MSDQPTEPIPTVDAPSAPPKRTINMWYIGAVLGIVGAGLVLTLLTSDVSNVSEAGIRLVDNRPFLEQQIGDWTGGPMSGLTKDEERLLPKDTECARRLYKDKNGHEVWCSIVLAGRDVTSIHRPELCLPSQGWQPENKHVELIPTPSVHSGKLGIMQMDTVRSFTPPGGQRQEARAIFAYWFIGKNRMTPHHWQRIFWTSRDRVFHNTNHRWAYVLIQVPVTGNWVDGNYDKAKQDALQTLRQFVADIYPTVAIPNS